MPNAKINEIQSTDMKNLAGFLSFSCSLFVISISFSISSIGHHSGGRCVACSRLGENDIHLLYCNAELFFQTLRLLDGP